MVSRLPANTTEGSRGRTQLLGPCTHAGGTDGTPSSKLLPSAWPQPQLPQPFWGVKTAEETSVSLSLPFKINKTFCSFCWCLAPAQDFCFKTVRTRVDPPHSPAAARQPVVSGCKTTQLRAPNLPLHSPIYVTEPAPAKWQLWAQHEGLPARLHPSADHHDKLRSSGDMAAGPGCLSNSPQTPPPSDPPPPKI